MATVFRAFPSSGIIALFDEPNTTGDLLDIDASRNQPAKNPEDWLANVRFHSDLDFMEVAQYETGITINHASVAASTTPPNVLGTTFGWSNATADHLLVQHDLGYVPLAMCIFDDEMLDPVMPVQSNGTGGVRYACIYCTTTQVRLFEIASAGAGVLAAADIDYSVIVIAEPVTASGGKLVELDPDEGNFTLALGKIDLSKQYLQVVPDGSPFAVSVGKTSDAANGCLRSVTPGGTIFDPTPAMNFTLTPVVVSTTGTTIIYNGDFEGSENFQVEVPVNDEGVPDGMVFNPTAKTLTFGYNGRKVIAGDRKMVCRLPTHLATIDDPEIVVGAFPDFPKDYTCHQTHTSNWNGSPSSPQYVGGSLGEVAFTRKPQEWSSTSVIAEAPEGVDAFAGWVRITRTTNPTHSWNAQAIDIRPPVSQWIPIFGGVSIPVECEVPFTRLAHIYLDDGDLVLELQQSLGGPPGGYGQTGSIPPGGSSDTSGARRSSGTGQGWPVYVPGVSPYRKTSGWGPSFFVPVGWDKHWIGGSDAPSTSDFTSYASTYQFEIAGQWSRRS